jgi:hypothetical protein
MRHSIRLTIGAAALTVLAACSRPSEQPALSDVQLAGAPSGRTDVVSAVERTDGAVAAPKAPTVSRAPSAIHGRTAVVRSARHVTPAAAQPAPRAEEPAPAEVRREEPAPEPAPSQARPQAPLPSTQREPPGGWRTPGQVIRNAPFPINP